jgi:hypothetical protein
MIGSLSHLIRGAAVDAIHDGTQKITEAHLEAILLDHAAETAAPKKRATRRTGVAWTPRWSLRCDGCRYPRAGKRETIGSFLRRLATVNHLAEDDLADTVAAERRAGRAVIKRRFTTANLAAVTGHSTETLNPRPARACPAIEGVLRASRDPGQPALHHGFPEAPQGLHRAVLGDDLDPGGSWGSSATRCSRSGPARRSSSWPRLRRVGSVAVEDDQHAVVGQVFVVFENPESS